MLRENASVFENLLYQSAADFLADDIANGNLPQALLLAGPAMSGKLTAALEIARVLSCSAQPKGLWQCSCPSCTKHKSLTSPSVLLAGSRDCTLEISAAAHTLVRAVREQASYVGAARYLFIRSVRKLTGRFNQVLWEGDEKVSKIAAITSVIDEMLEELDPARPLPELSASEKSVEALVAQCIKLESAFMYDSVPVSQIRRAAAWARLTAVDGKRVMIFERADRMQDSVRNALLKILEEPPSDTFFVLTAERKNAVLPTVLSRVRTYAFAERSPDRQREVVQRIFHEDGYNSVAAYLNGFLPVGAEDIQTEARHFTDELTKGEVPDIDALVKRMKNFEPRIMLSLFFNAVLDAVKKACGFAAGRDFSSEAYKTRITGEVKRSYEDIVVYNQTPLAALESLAYAFLEEGER